MQISPSCYRRRTQRPVRLVKVLPRAIRLVLIGVVHNTLAIGLVVQENGSSVTSASPAGERAEALLGNVSGTLAASARDWRHLVDVRDLPSVIDSLRIFMKAQKGGFKNFDPSTQTTEAGALLNQANDGDGRAATSGSLRTTLDDLARRRARVAASDSTPAVVQERLHNVQDALEQSAAFLLRRESLQGTRPAVESLQVDTKPLQSKSSVEGMMKTVQRAVANYDPFMAGGTTVAMTGTQRDTSLGADVRSASRDDGSISATYYGGFQGKGERDVPPSSGYIGGVRGKLGEYDLKHFSPVADGGADVMRGHVRFLHLTKDQATYALKGLQKFSTT